MNWNTAVNSSVMSFPAPTVGAGNDVTLELTSVGVGEVLPTLRVGIPTSVGGLGRTESPKFRLSSTTGTHHNSQHSHVLQ